MKNKIIISFITPCQIKPEPFYVSEKYLSSLYSCYISTGILAVSPNSESPCRWSLTASWGIHWRFALVLWKLVKLEEKKKTERPPTKNQRQDGKHVMSSRVVGLNSAASSSLVLKWSSKSEVSEPAQTLSAWNEFKTWGDKWKLNEGESLALEGPWAIPRACCCRNLPQKHNGIPNLL